MTGGEREALRAAIDEARRRRLGIAAYAERLDGRMRLRRSEVRRRRGVRGRRAIERGLPICPIHDTLMVEAL